MADEDTTTQEFTPTIVVGDKEIILGYGADYSGEISDSMLEGVKGREYSVYTVLRNSITKPLYYFQVYITTNRDEAIGYLFAGINDAMDNKTTDQYILLAGDTRVDKIAFIDVLNGNLPDGTVHLFEELH
jgi:hypothetical protein